MSRPAPSRRPARAVLALAVAATSLVGLSQASAATAPPRAPAAQVTYAVTGVSPAYVEAGVPDAFGVTLTGKGFTRNTRVKFGTCPEGTAVAPSTLSATKLVVQPPTCAAGPQEIVISESGAKPAKSFGLKDRFAFLAKPVVEALAPSTAALAPLGGPWSGGTSATVTVKADVPAKAPVQVLVTTAAGTKPVPGKVETGSAKKVSFKVPPGVPGEKAAVAVSVFGIASDSVPGLFTYQSTIKTSPNVWVKGATTPPAVKVDGAGFTKDATVEVCDVLVPATAVVVKSAKTLVVTPPAWADLTGKVDADKGGVCTVQVTVGGVVSAITAGSTFTYAAY